MREAEDQEELDAYPEHDEPVVRCPECGDDDRHEPDCSRNYRNRRYPSHGEVYDPKLDWPERYSNGLPI